MFKLSPEVEKEIKQSCLFSKAFNCLEKIFSYPKSLEQAVIIEESAPNENAANGGLTDPDLNLTINSAHKWDDCEWLPPFPQIITLPFFLIVSFILFATK